MAQSLFHRGIGYSHKAEKIAFDKEGNVLRAEYVEHYPRVSSRRLCPIVK